MDRLESEHWWFKARRGILSSVLDHIRGGRSNLKILEAGCGTGGNLRMLNRFGKVSAFEPDTGALRMARGKSGCRIEKGALPAEIPFRPGSFDVAVALDVIEHIEDDEAGLAALRRQLKPGGKLLMTVPALPWLWSAHDEQHHHYRRYTRAELNQKLQKAGFKPLKLSYFNTLLFPAVLAFRALKKIAGGTSSDDHMPPPALNATLRKVFEAERFLIGRLSLPFGVSLLAVCEGAE
ncbi:MAG: class I SAM-dependent methyltransferase [Pseudomonadota bacterium]